MTPQSVSVVIPVYNAETNLADLLARLYPILVGLRVPFEVVLVNDGSADRSWTAIEDLVARYPRVVGIDLSRNYGQHNALLCGIRAAQHAVVVTMDDDLQHPPEELPLLLAALDGHDVVYGTPEAEQHGLLRDLASRMTKSLIQHLTGSKTAITVSAFRAFRTILRDAFERFENANVSIDVLLTWATTRFTSLAVRHDPRRSGNSGYTLSKLVTHAMNLFTGFSTMPLRFAAYLGFACTLLGMVAMVWVLVAYVVYGPVVPGFAFLASMIAVFSGAQMFALGILGEYLARVHLRLMDRPTYIVRTTRSSESAQRAA